MIITEGFKEFLLTIQAMKDGDKYVDKISYTLQIIAQEKIPSNNYLKPIKGGDWKGLFEVRVAVGKRLFRIFCLFPEENYGEELVLLNGFEKKDEKTIKKYKSLALRLREDYLESKKLEKDNPQSKDKIEDSTDDS